MPYSFENVRATMTLGCAGMNSHGARVAWVVGEIVVGFVHQEERGGRHGLEERGHFIAGDNCTGGIVGIADVDDARFGGAGRGHFREVVTMVGGKWDQHGIGVQDARVVKHSFESGRGGDDVLCGIKEGVVRSAENFGGAAAEDNIFGLQVIFLRKRVLHLAIGFIGVAIRDGAAIGEGCAGLGRRAIGVFVEAQADGAGGHRFALCRIQ